MGTLLQRLFGKKKTFKLEFCQNNLDRFFDQNSLSLFNQFFNERSVISKEFECLSHCKLCKDKAYAVVNGDVIRADDAGELLEKLRAL